VASGGGKSAASDGGVSGGSESTTSNDNVSARRAEAAVESKFLNRDCATCGEIERDGNKPLVQFFLIHRLP
jgi:hypothetical protein